MAVRTSECTPSAPTTRSASRTVPSSRVTVPAATSTARTRASYRVRTPASRAAAETTAASRERRMVRAGVPSARGEPRVTVPSRRPVAPYIALRRLGTASARTRSSTPSASRASTPFGARVSTEPASPGSSARRSRTSTSKPARCRARAVAGPATPPPTTSARMGYPFVRLSCISIFEGYSWRDPASKCVSSSVSSGGRCRPTSAAPRRTTTPSASDWASTRPTCGASTGWWTVPRAPASSAQPSGSSPLPPPP